MGKLKNCWLFITLGLQQAWTSIVKRTWFLFSLRYLKWPFQSCLVTPMLYGLWGDTLKVCSIFLKLKEVGVLQPPVCTLKPPSGPLELSCFRSTKKLLTAASIAQCAASAVHLQPEAAELLISQFPVRFCSDIHRQWWCLLLERTRYSSYVLTTAIISSLWVSGIKIMEKAQINQQQYLFYCFPPCISVKKTVC